jgi:hypothetical protein
MVWQVKVPNNDTNNAAAGLQQEESKGKTTTIPAS